MSCLTIQTVFFYKNQKCAQISTDVYKLCFTSLRIIDYYEHIHRHLIDFFHGKICRYVQRRLMIWKVIVIIVYTKIHIQLSILTHNPRRLFIMKHGKRELFLLLSSDIYSCKLKKELKKFKTKTIIEVIPLISCEQQALLFSSISNRKIEKVISLSQTNSNKVTNKSNMDKDRDKSISLYLSHDYISIPVNSTIPSAMHLLIEKAEYCENVYTVLVVDNEKYIGTIDLKNLIIARKDDDFKTLVDKKHPFFYEDEKIDKCLTKTDNNRVLYPVLNRNGYLIGAVLQKDLKELNVEEFKEDYAKFGGLIDDEEKNEPLNKSIKKRIPWLIILLFLGLAVSAVIGNYEKIIATFPVIVFFQSMILDMAGNAGTQSLAVTIRSISENYDNKTKSCAKTIFKEIKIGIINGFLIAIISFFVVFAYLAFTKQELSNGFAFSYANVAIVSGIVASSMFISICLSNFIGSFFPIILTKIKIDPAVASGPFITTINDIIAISIYYGLSILFLKQFIF